MIMSKKPLLTHFPLIVISDIVARNNTFSRTDLQFVITGLVETESTYFKQVEKDSIDVKEIVQHKLREM